MGFSVEQLAARALRFRMDTLERESYVFRQPCGRCKAKACEPCVTVGGRSPGSVLKTFHHCRRQAGAHRFEAHLRLLSADPEIESLTRDAVSLARRLARARRVEALVEVVEGLEAELAALSGDDQVAVVAQGLAARMGQITDTLDALLGVQKETPV